MVCPGTNTIAELVCQQLAPGAAADVEAHAAGCADCRKVIGQLARSSLARLAATPGDRANGAPRARGVLLRPGTAIARYAVVELIGAGGMGVVYAAHDPELDRRVALKLLHPELAADPGRARVELLAEAQAMARLRHPNIVTVYDAGTHDEQVFVAMELIEGETLRGWLAAPRTPAEIARVLAGAARGLAAAHAVGIVHCDFKPENVLIDARGRVYVSDFGLARPAGIAGEIGGTPRYMAPEQRAGAASDPRHDQYSFGVVLGEALGERAPRWLADIGRRARDADPARRHASLDEVADLLERGPARTWRRIAVAASVLGVIGVATWALATRSASRALACPLADDKLAGVWDHARRDALVQHLTAAGPFGPDVARTTAAALDAYRDRWALSWTDTCKGSQRGEQSTTMFDLRVACLSHRLDALDTLVSALAAKAPVLAAKAPGLVDDLEPIAPCDDAVSLLRVAPPAAKDRAAVDDIDRLLATAVTQRAEGQFKAARATLEQALAQAQRVGYRPSEAKALDHLGNLEIDVGDYAAAEQQMRRASSVAIAANDDYAAAQALIDLVDVVGYQLGKTEEGYRLVDLAQASLERIGNPPAIRVRLLDAKSKLLLREDKQRDALALLDQSIAIAEQPGGDLSELSEALEAKQIALFDLSRFDDARALSERDVALRAKMVGTHHPSYAHALLLRANVEMVANDWEKARADLHEARAIDVAALGADTPELVGIENNLGALEGELGDWTEALRAQRASLVLARRQSADEDPDVLMIRINIAEALRQVGQLDEADAELRSALADAERVLGPDHQHVGLALQNLGELRLAQHRAREALAPFTRARDIYVKGLGADSPRVDYATSGLGRAQLATGELRAASTTLAATVERLEHSRIDPVLLARTRLALADASWRSGERPAATAQVAKIATDLAVLPAGADRALRDDVATWQAAHAKM